MERDTRSIDNGSGDYARDDGSRSPKRKPSDQNTLKAADDAAAAGGGCAGIGGFAATS